MESSFVTIKVSKEAHEKLRNFRLVFFMDTYPEVVNRLLEEHRQKEVES